MSRYRLKDMREDRDLLQKDLAKLLNTTQQHYSRIENGDTEITADRVCKLAEFYHTSTDYILGRTDERKPYNVPKIKQ
ncbi:MAG: helix-turn-helix transcriptional regulator [Bacilli bacterium]|nr:helix-turn-helix transcriptional regulator [Bacilli bacterium]MBQ8902253.1 helix-turn-helix transcriptional regulator [Bacilli bacterium]